jgi:queuine tRNA-ribosyltransferase
MSAPISFNITARLQHSLGRAGSITTPHGDIPTPAFVTVGTKASVKSLTPHDLKAHVGNHAALANTYHLFLQPGHEVVKEAGGLHAFMQWDGPLMTDSGGFQVFSLGAAFGKGVTKFAKEGDIEKDEAVEREARPTIYSKEIAAAHGKLCVVDEEGVTFTSHIDGSMHRFTAERSIEIQQALGADIIVAFDECTSPGADYDYQKEALERTHRWAKRSVMAHRRDYQAVKKQGIYGVVQGGRHLDLRTQSAHEMARLDFDGFGVGGSFSKEDLSESLRVVNAILPEHKPRHLLGIGEPEDIFMGVENGCDTFDCVAPTRIGRTGTIYTHGEGKLDLRKARFVRDFGKPDLECMCYTCTTFTRAYLNHLLKAGEMLGAHLCSIHNLHFIVQLTERIRISIIDGTYPQFKKNFLNMYCIAT